MPTIQDWLWIEVMFTQALLGAISPNVRRIVISFDQGEWVLIATLENESENDVEEMEDAVDEFSVLLEDIKKYITDKAYTKARAETVVSNDPLRSINSEFKRVIFQRRE